MAKAKKTASRPALAWGTELWGRGGETRNKDGEHWTYGVPRPESAKFAWVPAR